MNPHIYLDIDGVILANDRNLANGADKFIRYIVANYPVTWASTHCMHNDPETAVKRLEPLVEAATLEALRKIRGSSWSIAKTELFDWSKPFLFIDDDCYPEEQADLVKHQCLDNWVKIDLFENENQLLDLLDSFPIATQPMLTPIPADQQN